ncbi:hypothetical protein MKW92_039335 [Papaver armeniacum]|nr:hypothetical protein MKW92_039335 [Papaver armeniacum]
MEPNDNVLQLRLVTKELEACLKRNCSLQENDQLRQEVTCQQRSITSKNRTKTEVRNPSTCLDLPQEVNGKKLPVKTAAVSPPPSPLPSKLLRTRNNEANGDFIRYLTKEVENAPYKDISNIKAVKPFPQWPERKADALPKATFNYQDQRNLESEVSSFRDKPKQPNLLSLEKMQDGRDFNKIGFSI